VYEYVLVPAHTGSVEITGAETVRFCPQLSITAGGEGVTARDTHETVEAPVGGIVTIGELIVYV